MSHVGFWLWRVGAAGEQHRATSDIDPILLAVPDARSLPLRLLVVCPSWLGDCVMATPTLRRLREGLPGAFIGILVRPGMDELLGGLPYFDEVHVARASGVMGPKFVAAKVRPRRYDCAVLLTNSFSTALTVRIAGIPRRIGYDRDARGLLLTDRLPALRRGSGGFAPVPAVSYYLRAADHLLGRAHDPEDLGGRLELAVSEREEQAAAEILRRAGVGADEPRVLLNPGGNNPAKRWPADRYALIARGLHERGLRVLINGSPGEAELVDEIVRVSGVERVVALPRAGVTIGSLKALVRGAKLMVTNDTGPRHIAAAFGVRLVTLFGPTDHRWTTIPTLAAAREAILVADPTLPEHEVADEHPERCRVDRISVEQVVRAMSDVGCAISNVSGSEMHRTHP
jgi:heptosyltransferase-2